MDHPPGGGDREVVDGGAAAERGVQVGDGSDHQVQAQRATAPMTHRHLEGALTIRDPT